MATSSSFGTIESNGNSNIRMSGNGNVGTLAFNANLFLHAIASSLYIVENQNCNFKIEESDINSIKNMNTKINGKKNDLKLDSNQNVKIKGDLNKLTFKDNQNGKLDGSVNEGTFISNTNFNYCGDNGKSIYGSDNTNMKIMGNHNTITASNNENLKVEGDHHQLVVSDTQNHVFKTVPDTSSENVLRIKPDSYQNYGRTSLWRSWLGNVNTNNGISVTYYIDYVSEATVRRNEYKLGIFKFKMERKDNTIQIQLDNSNLDTDSFQVAHSSVEKYTMMGSKEGKKEMLSIIGPVITAQNLEQVNVLIINLISNTAN